MDWRSVKFDWNRARAFLVTAEEGSLAAAARAMGMNQPTLGRQVAALEEELGITLFNRSGRGLELTPGGLELIEHVRAMGDAANRLSLTASGQAESIEGNICITATELTAMYFLPQIVKKLRKMEPGIHVEIIASNEERNLMRREADIAIRGFRPTQPDLIAKKIIKTVAHLYATPEYLQSIGNPATPAEFSEAEFIGSDYTDMVIVHLNQSGFTLTRRNFPVMVGNHIVQWELVKQGLGIGLMMQEIGDAEPGLKRALPDFKSYSGEAWLVTHNELKTNRRIRLVFDLLAAEIEKLNLGISTS